MHDNDQRQRCRRECSPPPPRTKPEITSGENKASKERERASHKSCQATQSAVRRRHRVLRVANRKNKASNLPTQERNTKLWSQESDVGSKNPGRVGMGPIRAAERDVVKHRHATLEVLTLALKTKRFIATILTNLYRNRDVSSIFITSCTMCWQPCRS